MPIQSILEKKLTEIYQVNEHLFDRLSKQLKHELDDIVEVFYQELGEIPEAEKILANSIVKKNLKMSLKH